MFTVILNPKSGTGSKVDGHLADLFRAEGAEIRTVALIPERADAIIREAVANPGDAVVAAGGDGTVSRVAAALAGSRTPLGVLPFGTLNHFARDLRIPMDERGAVKTIVAGHVSVVDMGYVNDRPFINNSSIGVYPGIVELREELKRQGHRKWTAFAIAIVRTLERDTDVFVRVNVNGRSVVTRTPFLFVGNNEYTIEGIHLGTRARINAGTLCAYLAPRLRTHELPKLLLWALIGRARQRGGFAAFTSADVWIETPQSRAVRVATDGEITELKTPFHFRAAPGALHVIVPAS